MSAAAAPYKASGRGALVTRQLGTGFEASVVTSSTLLLLVGVIPPIARTQGPGKY